MKAEDVVVEALVNTAELTSGAMSEQQYRSSISMRPDCAATGIYFATQPEHISQSRTKVIFVDPRGTVQRAMTHGQRLNVWEETGHAGDLLLFPPWLQKEVVLQRGMGMVSYKLLFTVSSAFQVKLRSKCAGTSMMGVSFQATPASNSSTFNCFLLAGLS